MKQGKLFNNVVDFINWNFCICSSSHWHHTGVVIFKRLFKFYFKSLFHPVPCTHISKRWKVNYSQVTWNSGSFLLISTELYLSLILINFPKINAWCCVYFETSLIQVVLHRIFITFRNICSAQVICRGVWYVVARPLSSRHGQVK